MIIVDKLLTGGIRFVLDKVVNAAEAEMQDDSTLQQQLLEAQIRFEMGQLSAADLSEIERDIFARLRQVRANDGQGAVGLSHEGEGLRISGVDVSLSFDGDEERCPAAR